jgi:hydrogenase expression/formation protein HypC
MCLGIPMQIMEINGLIAVAEVNGVKRDIGLELVENPQIGDYVIVHAGFAIEKLNQEEAEETIRLLEEYRIAAQ